MSGFGLDRGARQRPVSCRTLTVFWLDYTAVASHKAICSAQGRSA